jgi:hypothetical protein
MSSLRIFVWDLNSRLALMCLLDIFGILAKAVLREKPNSKGVRRDLVIAECLNHSIKARVRYYALTNTNHA